MLRTLTASLTLACAVAVAACGAPPPQAHADVVARLATGDCGAGGAADACAIDAGGIAVHTPFTAAFDVVNGGATDAEIVNVTLAGDPSFAIDQAPATSLPAGASSPLAWTVTPATTGALASTLTITWREVNGGSADVVVRLAAHGVDGVRVTPATCDFGDVPVGTTSAPCTFHFDNTTDVEQQIDEFLVTSPVFAVAGTILVPAFIQPLRSFDIALTATPAATGSTQGALSFAQGTSVIDAGLSLRVNGT